MSELTPEQYEMLFGEPPPVLDASMPAPRVESVATFDVPPGLDRPALPPPPGEPTPTPSLLKYASAEPEPPPFDSRWNARALLAPLLVLGAVALGVGGLIFAGAFPGLGSGSADQTQTAQSAQSSDEAGEPTVAAALTADTQAQSTTTTTTTSTTSTTTTTPPEPPPVSIFERAISAGELAVATEALEAASVLPLLKPDVPFERDDYQTGWGDSDGDCLSDRHEILLERSEIPTIGGSCRVDQGRWTDPYDGTVMRDAQQVTIDHFVPLSEAHRAGGWAWDDASKAAYAADIGFRQTHVPATKETNQAKGDSGPDEWRPGEDAWCAYAIDWISVKTRWDLAFSEAEVEALNEMLGVCEPVATAATTATTIPLANPTIAG